MGAWRLAAPPLGVWPRSPIQRRPRPAYDSADQPLENAQQPAANAVSAAHLFGAAGWMDAGAACRGDLERVRRRDVRDSPFASGGRRDRAATAQPLAADALARGRRRFHARAATDRAAGH